MRDGVRLRLCIMMFLEYAVWGAWGVSIGGYMYETLHFDGDQVGWMFSTTAVAAMISPLFVGYVADRFFATEKLLAGLHLIGAVLLAIAAFMHDFTKLFTVMQAYAICYMPTLALTNSISFANIADSKKDFPGIRVWGTWGWIVVGWVIGFLVGGKSNNQFFLAAGLSAILAVFCLYLPHTPPRAKTASATPTANQGQGMFRLLADPDVSGLCRLFVPDLHSLVVLLQPGERVPGTTRSTLPDCPADNRPAFRSRLYGGDALLHRPAGRETHAHRRHARVGAAIHGLRDFDALRAVIFGLFLHGVCYDFYFVASYIYVDTRVDGRATGERPKLHCVRHAGCRNVRRIDRLRAELSITIRRWSRSRPRSRRKCENDPATASHCRNGTRPANRSSQGHSISRTNSVVVPVEDSRGLHRDRQGPGDRDALRSRSLVEGAIKADRNADGKIDRQEWVIARRRQWPFIWLWPAAGALVTCIIFVIGFRERVPTAGEENVGFQAVPEEAEP